MSKQKITPFLWFEKEAEEAANFYVSLFKNARVGKVLRMPEGGPGPAGAVLTVTFEIDGQEYVALNGRAQAGFTDAVSFQIHCADQAEVDHFWDGFIAGGGEPSMCGWLRDRFGVSWQVTPARLPELLSDKDPGVAQRVMQAMMKMRKIEVAPLEAAARAG